jgi:hypothetical protein
MALNKDSKDLGYNLGRVVAIVEIIEGENLFSLVFNNAKEKLPFYLNKALSKKDHNLNRELVGPAEFILSKELPSKVITAIDDKGTYSIGYYHQKSYLEGKYHGNYGIVETTIEHHTPYIIEDKTDSNSVGVSIVKDNVIDDLKREC